MSQAPLIDYSGAKAQLVMPPSLCNFVASNFAQGTGGAAAAVTADADSARPNIIRQIQCSYSATPAGGGVTIEDGSGNIVWEMLIATAGEHSFDFPNPKAGTANTAMIVTLLAPGGSITGSIYADIYRHK